MGSGQDDYDTNGIKMAGGDQTIRKHDVDNGAEARLQPAALPGGAGRGGIVKTQTEESVDSVGGWWLEVVCVVFQVCSGERWGLGRLSRLTNGIAETNS